MIKICPERGQLVAFNPYFQAWLCLNSECDWIEEVTEAGPPTIEGRNVESLLTILETLIDVIVRSDTTSGLSTQSRPGNR